MLMLMKNKGEDDHSVALYVWKNNESSLVDADIKMYNLSELQISSFQLKLSSSSSSSSRTFSCFAKIKT